MKPKKVRLYVNGERQKDVYLNKTKFQVFKYKAKKFIKKVIIGSLIMLCVYVVYTIGGYMNPAIIYTKAEVIKEVEAKAPILEKIAKCESGNMQYKNGQLVVNANRRGGNDVDVGVFQINIRIHGAKATELGYNLAIEKDNRAYAQYLYNNFGTDAWVWSKSCWSR